MRRVSIGLKLFIIYALIALPLVSLISFTYYKWYQTRIDRVLVERTQLAELTASTFDLFLNEISASMEFAGRGIISGEETTETIRSNLNNILHRYPVSHVVLADQTSKVVMCSDGIAIGTDLSGEPAFRAALRDKHYTIQPANNKSDPPGFYIVQSLHSDSGKIEALMACFVDISKLRTALPVRIEKGSVCIIDSNANLIYHSENPSLLTTHPNWRSHPYVQQALNGKNATDIEFTFPGSDRERIETAVPIPKYGWVAGSGIDKQQMLGPIQSYFLNAVFIFTLILLAAFLMSFFMARRIVTSLTGLAVAARSFGEGDFDRPIQASTGDEIEDVAISLDEARINLKQAREKLELSEARFRALFEQVAVGVSQVSLEGRWLLVNQKTCDIVGYDADELSQMTFQEITYPEDLEVDLAYLDLLIEGHIPSYSIEKRYIRKDGELVWVNLSVSLVRDQAGNADYVIAVIEDINKRRELEDFNIARNEVNAIINSTMDVDEIINNTLRIVSATLGSDSSAVFIRQEDSWIQKYSLNRPGDTIGARITKDNAGILEYTVQQRTSVPIEDAQHDDRLNTEFMKKYGIKSRLMVPLSVRKTDIGVMALDFSRKQTRFTKEQIDFVNKVAVGVSFSLENAQLFNAQQTIADTLQTALLEIPGSLKGLQIGHVYQTATESARVGGDFYDIFEIDAKFVGVLLGDVSGKGVPAATLTAAMKNTVHAYALESLDPSWVITKTNEAIRRISKPSSFITCIYAVLNRETGELVYCNAGHPAGIIHRDDGSIDLLPATSPLIGVFCDLVYENAVSALGEGDTLILYSDGVIEARLPDRGFFGEQRLLDVINKTEPATAKDLPKAIYEETIRCCGNQLADDLAILAISRAT